MASPQQRAKQWGYEVEVQTISALAPIFPRLRRTGSMAYKKAAADLVADGKGEPILLVVTKDKGPGNPLLVTLRATDLEDLVRGGPSVLLRPTAVQVKGRGQTWIGKLWRELRDSVKGELRASVKTEPGS